MRLADATGAVVVLKGNPTFVAGLELAVVDSGGPELATIGTGDVLAGLIAALLADGLPAEVAARIGAYLHGVAGAQLSESGAVVATDLVAEVGLLVNAARQNAAKDA
jgi:NAD(P)H-hydrate epimerase